MPSVLIVDDEPNIRRMVGALLSAEGYEVRDAPDGASGLARAAESEPDALLLDLMMPGELDGMATLARMRESLPRDLVESEMFGHERGAFTGATDRRIGRFELAHRGTLLLDEIGDLGPEAQAKLLRAIESHEIERLGGAKPIRVDVRIVSATNKDLNQATQDGAFRDDLLFRL